MSHRVRYDEPFGFILKYGSIFWLVGSGFLLLYGIIFMPQVFTGERSWALILIVVLLIILSILYFRPWRYVKWHLNRRGRRMTEKTMVKTIIELDYGDVKEIHTQYRKEQLPSSIEIFGHNYLLQEFVMDSENSVYKVKLVINEQWFSKVLTQQK